MTVSSPDAWTRFPIVVCLFGTFRILRNGAPVLTRPGGKVEQFLASLALGPRLGIPREDLIGMIWPDSDEPLARQSLNSLVYSLRRSLGGAIAGRSPILESDGRYTLNVEGGVAVDVLQFDSCATRGDRLVGTGNRRAAIEAYEEAIRAYCGDLVLGSGLTYLVERERLRARLLLIRARLSDLWFEAGDYAAALDHAFLLLAQDPCREDAHRMAMRCYVRLGARAQALRQYRICRDILGSEFDALPEDSTEHLYELVRLDPGQV